MVHKCQLMTALKLWMSDMHSCFDFYLNVGFNIFHLVDPLRLFIQESDLTHQTQNDRTDMAVKI